MEYLFDMTGFDAEPEFTEREVTDCFIELAMLRFLRNLMINCSREELEYRCIFTPVKKYISRIELQELVNSCTTEKILREMEQQHRHGKLDFAFDPEETILMELWCHPRSNHIFRREMVKLIDKNMAEIRPTSGADTVRGKFDELREFFSLDELESDLLLLIALYSCEFCWNCTDLKKTEESPKKVRIMANALGVSPGKLLPLLKNGAKLRRYLCIDEDFMLSDHLISFISGLEDRPLASCFYTERREQTLPWEIYGDLAANHGELLKKLIKNRLPDQSLNILLYGEPGTGKTSFAHSLAAELGLKAYNIAQNCFNRSANDFRNTNFSVNFRFAAVKACDEQVDQDRSLIIVDESDELLAGKSNMFRLFSDGHGDDGGKGMLNCVLDELKTPCVWITNTTASMLALSSRRRFNYSVRFDSPTASQRRIIWNNAIVRHQLENALPKMVVDKMAAAFEVSAGGIDLTLRSFKGLCKAEKIEGEHIEQTIRRLIEPHCELLELNRNCEQTVATDYALEGLNIKGPFPLERIEAAIRRFQNEQRLGRTLGVDSPRMNLLLHGHPGTGKTEFVKYLGNKLDARIIAKTGSDILGKYVGETEQNIKDTFVRARAEKAILFLDEIDGLLQTREHARHSWEVTQVNELLCQMENFSGILICATNFASRLDPATMRRFTYKIEFDYLNDEGKLLFFSKMLSDLCPGELDKAALSRLLSISRLTPGDFRTVRQEFYYLECENVKPDAIIDALERESLARKRLGAGENRIGFAGCIAQ